MFRKGQSLWCIDGVELVTCTFVCNVVHLDGVSSGKYAVEIKKGTITTLYISELFEKETVAKESLIEIYKEKIKIKKRKIENLKKEINGLEKCKL